MRNSLPLELDLRASGKPRIHIKPARSNRSENHHSEDDAGRGMSGEGIAEEHAQSRSRNRTDKGGQGEVAELYRSKGCLLYTSDAADE